MSVESQLSSHSSESELSEESQQFVTSQTVLVNVLYDWYAAYLSEINRAIDNLLSLEGTFIYDTRTPKYARAATIQNNNFHGEGEQLFI